MNESTEMIRVVPDSKRSRDEDGLHKRRGIWHYKLKVAGRWKELSTAKINYLEAKKVRQQAIQDQEAGRLPTDMAKWTLEKASTEWLAGRANLVAFQTHRIDRERMKPLLKAFGGLRLVDITSQHVRGYQHRRMNQVSTRTINLETKVLRMILRSVKLWSRIADDYKPLRENRRGPGKALSPEQEQHLFSVASSRDAWQAAYYAGLLAANTTARSCELKGLRLADVDLLSDTLTIRRVSTKTDAGCRVIPLNEKAVWACARLMERGRELGATEPEHYLFPASSFRRTKEPNASGSGYDPTQPQKTWRTAWRSLTEEAGLKGLRFHDLRHHCITRLAEEVSQIKP